MLYLFFETYEEHPTSCVSQKCVEMYLTKVFFFYQPTELFPPSIWHGEEKEHFLQQSKLHIIHTLYSHSAWGNLII